MSVTSKRSSQVISYLLSFILCLLLIVGSLCAILQATVLNENFFKQQMRRSNYSTLVTSLVQDRFVSYGMAAGFDQETCKSLLTKEQVEADAQKIVQFIYESGKGPDYDAFQKSIMQKLTENAKSRGFQMTAENTKAIQRMAETCRISYQQIVALPAPFVSALRSLVPKAKRVLLLGGFGALVMIAVAVFLLKRLHHMRSFYRFCIYAVSGALLLLAGGSGGILLSGKIERIGIVLQPQYKLTVIYLHQMIFYAFIMAAVLAAVTVVLAVLYVHRCKQHTSSADPQHAKGVYAGKLLK